MIEETKALHERLDGFFDRLRVDYPQDFNPPCRAGCHWCCYEAVMASRHEADYIIAGLDQDQRAALKIRLRKWLTDAKPLLELNDIEGIALPYRRAHVPCPLLVDGQCSVYDRRPIGCRVFFAHSHPENCAMPMREHQKYAAFPHPSPIDQFIMQHILDCGGNVQFDHLGIHLANRLFGLNLESKVAKGYEIETEQEATP